MIFDVETTPDLDSLEINGKLTFENNDVDRALSVHNLWVRKGQLFIGTSDEGFTANANIHLLGDGTREHFAEIDGLPTGNKNLVITNKADFFGV